MYLRIVRGRTQAGQVDELARRWHEILAPRLQSAPGFRHAYFVGNRDTNTAVGVTVWDTLPDQALPEQFRQQVQDIITGPPEIEDYEVLVEV